MKLSSLKTCFLFISLFALSSFTLTAQTEEGKVYQFGDEDAIHIVSLRNGNVLRGRILNIPLKYRSDANVTMLFYEKEIVVKYRDILKIEVTGPEENAATTVFYSEVGIREKYRSQGLFASSTAIPMPKGINEMRGHVPTAAGIVTAEFGLGGGVSLTAGLTLPGAILLLQGKYGARLDKNFHLGAGITTGTALGIGETEWAGVVYGMMTIGSGVSFFNLQIGTTLFPGDAEAVFIIPGISVPVSDRGRIGLEVFAISDDDEIYIPYLLPTFGWVFRNKNGGMDLGSILVPSLFDDDIGPVPIPYGTIYFRF